MFKSNEVFNGSIPPVCIAQILKTVDFSIAPEWFNGCCGTFTFEKAILAQHPELLMHSNDVSLLSGVMASLVGQPRIEFTFREKLAHWEERLVGRPYEDRIGALVLVLFLSRVFNGPSEYAKRHWRYYENRFDDFVAFARAKSAAMMAGVRLASYTPGDFRDHIKTAIERGAGVISSPPFIEGWYESWFRFLNTNIAWAEPAFGRWQPKDFPALLDMVDQSGVPYVLVYKQAVECRTPIVYHRLGMKPAFYVYGTAKRSSVVDRNSTEKGTPFRFKPVDITKITAASKVTIGRCKAGYADYIKSLYLQENIAWTSTPLNFLVYIDDMLAGIMSFSQPKQKIGPYGTRDYVYLMSDTATTRFGRVSKLIAMLASSEDVLRAASHLCHAFPKAVVTTVRSNQPVSMKYRNIYEILARREPGPEERSGSKYVINYFSEPRRQTPDGVFAEWFKRWYKHDRERKVTVSYAPRPDVAGDAAA